MIKTAAGATVGTAPPTHRFMRLPAVCETTGLKPSTLYAYVAAGKFPKPVKRHGAVSTCAPERRPCAVSSGGYHS